MRRDGRTDRQAGEEAWKIVAFRTFETKPKGSDDDLLTKPKTVT